MADHNKVLKGYEQCIKSGYLGGAFCNRNTCPYNQCEAKCVSTLIDDVNAMLKEQEAKTGHWISVNDGDVVTIDNDGFPERACFCSECKKYLIASDEYAVYGRYCPFCGAKMEGR